MGLEFLSPAFLAGLLAAGLPVVIHLIHRRRARILPIATLRFLRQIPLRTIRRHRLEEYVLLAARILLIALLALAGARPVLTDAAAAGGSTSLAVVLDDSFSMGYRVSGITRFQEAREAAVALLSSLEGGDKGALLLASRPEGETLTTDVPGLRRRAEATAISLLAPDLRHAVGEALRILGDADEPNRELAIVTDRQRRALEPVVDGVTVPYGEDAVRVVVVDVGAESPRNLAVTRVVAGYGVAVAGERVEVTADVRNVSTAPASTRVALVVGDQRIAESPLTIGAGETARATLSALTEVPGAESGRVLIPGDDLLADDARSFALEVMGRIPVLLVNGDPSPLPFQDETFFLRAALAPEELGAEGVTSPVRLRTIEADALAGEELAPFRVAILANVAEIDAPVARKLKAFVRAGGGLVIFLGNRIRADRLNSALGSDEASGLLPARLSAPAQVGGESAVIPVAEADLAHPLFVDLPAEAIEDLTRIHVRRAFGLDLGGTGGRAVATLTSGTPLIAEKEFGRGRVVLVNTSADSDWGNLVIRPLFLPLAHRLCRLLAGRGEEVADHALGEFVEIPRPVGDLAPPEVTDPRGDVKRPVPDDAQGGALVYGPLEIPGVYHVRGASEDDTFSFAANPDPAESDLSRMPVEALRDLFGAERFRLIRNATGLAGELRRSREGRPLWPALLVAALALLLFETFFANRVAKARAARAGEEEDV